MSTEDIICQKIQERRVKGLAKYGRSVDQRDDIDLLGWLTHLQEELMDAVIYLEKVKEDLDD